MYFDMLYHFRGLQALVENPSSGDKETYRYLLIEEDKASSGKISIRTWEGSLWKG